MNKIVTIRDTVRVPPNRFGDPLEDAVFDILCESYEGLTDRDLGTILAIVEVKEIGVGKVIMGDGASYHEVVFDALVYKPELNEVVMGEVVEIVSFGGFVRLGPLDGLVHVSQVMDDFVTHDEKSATLHGKQSKRVLKEGDRVRARIVTVSTKREVRGKIGLTMRQPGLGKPEWIKEERKGGKA